MIHRDQPAIAGGTEPHPLPCLRPVADGGEHLRPGQHQLDRAADDPGRERGQDHVRPGAESGPEPASQVRNENPDVGLRQIEHRCEGPARHHRVLARVVHGQPVAFPAGHRGEQPHRIGGHRRRGEDLVVDHLGGGQRGGDITAVDVLPPPIEQHRGTRIVDPQYRSGLFVVDLDQSRRGDAPVRASAPPRRPRAGRGGESGCPSTGTEARGRAASSVASARAGAFSCVITARTPGAASASAASMPPDRSSRDRGLHQDGMREVGEGEIRRVRRGARHLERPVDPIDGITDDPSRAWRSS